MKPCWRGLRIGFVAVGLVLALQGTPGAEEIKDRKALTEALARVRELRQQEKHQDSLTLAQRAVEAAEKLAGPESVETATALHELAGRCVNTKRTILPWSTTSTS